MKTSAKCRIVLSANQAHPISKHWNNIAVMSFCHSFQQLQKMLFVVVLRNCETLITFWTRPRLDVCCSLAVLNPPLLLFNFLSIQIANISSWFEYFQLVSIFPDCQYFQLVSIFLSFLEMNNSRPNGISWCSPLSSVAVVLPFQLLSKILAKVK